MVFPTPLHPNKLNGPELWSPRGLNSSVFLFVPRCCFFIISIFFVLTTLFANIEAWSCFARTFALSTLARPLNSLHFDFFSSTMCPPTESMLPKTRDSLGMPTDGGCEIQGRLVSLVGPPSALGFFLDTNWPSKSFSIKWLGFESKPWCSAFLDKASSFSCRPAFFRRTAVSAFLVILEAGRFRGLFMTALLTSCIGNPCAIRSGFRVVFSLKDFICVFFVDDGFRIELVELGLDGCFVSPSALFHFLFASDSLVSLAFPPII
mmetsp:Transcript_15136/g.26750  ORF Transcript_15136/g.26750 Transcript_15136/m.26750 type:complete len:263 (+) Transcript_15136:796-1584(+)